MPFVQDNSSYPYILRSASAHSAQINTLTVHVSFLLTPQKWIQEWRPSKVEELQPNDFDPVLALKPDVVLLATGQVHEYPSAQIQAICLTRGIGLEIMSNSAAARTFTVLAAEQRQVVLAMLLPGISM